MIWKLALEQLRANRTYTVWITALIAMTVTLLAYIVSVGAIQADIESETNRVMGQGYEETIWVIVALEGTPKYADELIDLADLEDEVARHGATRVIVQGELTTAASPDDVSADGWLNSVALTGDVEWAEILVEGDAPVLRHEIVLSADYATRLGAGVGEQVTLYSPWGYPGDHSAGPATSFTVTGLSASTRLAGFDVWPPAAYVSWAEATATDGAFAQVDRDENGVVTPRAVSVQATVNYDGGSALFDSHNTHYRYYSQERDISLAQSSAVWGIAALALLAATTVMAFAVGRSQAAARTQWVATARTMGARRRHIVAATLAETGIIAGVALAVGLLLGLLAAQAHLSAARSAVTYALGPAIVPATWYLFAVTGAAALVAATAIAAVPAFWAARIEPAAALKPVSDATESEISRRVPARWLLVPMTLGIVLVGASVIAFGNRGGVVTGTGLVMIAVPGIALVIEGTRRLIGLTGRALARSRRASLLSAGDALAARPRQGAGPALLWALAVGLIVLGASHQAQSYAYHYTSPYSDFDWTLGEAAYHWADGSATGTTVAAVILIALAVQLVVVGIFVSQRAATGGELAAERAMGLSAPGQRQALLFRIWIPQALGALVGIAAMTTWFVGFQVVEMLAGSRIRLLDVAWGAAGGVVAGLAVSGAMLVLAGGVAAVAARVLTPATPVAALQPVP